MRLVMILIGLVWAHPGHAERAREPAPEAGDDAADSIARGAFVGGAGAARADGRRGLGWTVVGYDTARKRQLVEAIGEVTLGDRVRLRAGGTLDTDQLQPSVSAQLDALRQERHGIDLAIASGYEHASFNTVPGVFARIGVAREIGATRLGASATLGIGLTDDERHGAVTAGGLTRVTDRLFVGAEARFAIDLERDDDEPEAEPDWQLGAGPVAAYALGRLVFTAQTGLAATRYRLVPGTRTGLLALLGAGTTF